MTLSALMKKGGLHELATAIPATAATEGNKAVKVAGVATIAVAGGHTTYSENACAGWPHDEGSGAPFCPWGPYVTPTMLDAWRRELRELVAELASAEGWNGELREQVAYCVEHQPGLATLRDDIGYFRQRLSEAQRGVERSQGWRCEGFADRHYCSGCDGSCIGTRQSCKRGSSPTTKTARKR
jgi:hypothetical protein